MKIGLTVPGDTVSKRTLDAAVEAATEVAQAQIEAGHVPPLADAIDNGVRWKPEDGPAGEESFDIPQDVMKRGWGDCDDLAPWWVAELRASDVDPDAFAEVYQSGPKRFHVVVRRSDGTVDDPSVWAGMSKGRVSGIITPSRRPLARQDAPLIVGFAPTKSGNVRARIDVPQVVGDLCGVMVERIGDNTIDALHRACCAAGVLAFWGAPDEVLARLTGCASAIREPVMGDDVGSWEDYIGAITASIDPTQAANIAATIFDPFGLRNLIAPAAQAFLQSSSPSAPAGGKVKATVTTSSGVGAATRGTQQSRGGAQQRGGRGGAQQQGRGGLQQTQQTQQQGGWYQDPQTGDWYDPTSGNWYDQSGLQLDPQTGVPMMYEQGGGYGGYSQTPQPYSLTQSYPQYPQYSPAQSSYYNPYASPYAQGPYSSYGYGVPYGYQPQQYSYMMPYGQ